MLPFKNLTVAVVEGLGLEAADVLCISDAGIAYGPTAQLTSLCSRSPQVTRVSSFLLPTLAPLISPDSQMPQVESLVLVLVVDIVPLESLRSRSPQVTRLSLFLLWWSSLLRPSRKRFVLGP